MALCLVSAFLLHFSDFNGSIAPATRWNEKAIEYHLLLFEGVESHRHFLRMRAFARSNDLEHETRTNAEKLQASPEEPSPKFQEPSNSNLLHFVAISISY